MLFTCENNFLTSDNRYISVMVCRSNKSETAASRFAKLSRMSFDCFANSFWISAAVSVDPPPRNMLAIIEIVPVIIFIIHESPGEKFLWNRI